VNRRLWYLPAALLSPAGLLTVERGRATVAAVADDWNRVLLSALGCCELLMAADSPTALMLVGPLGGTAHRMNPSHTSWCRALPRGSRPDRRRIHLTGLSTRRGSAGSVAR
jgi:hypothetical protein